MSSIRRSSLISIIRAARGHLCLAARYGAGRPLSSGDSRLEPARLGSYGKRLGVLPYLPCA